MCRLLFCVLCVFLLAAAGSCRKRPPEPEGKASSAPISDEVALEGKAPSQRVEEILRATCDKFKNATNFEVDVTQTMRVEGMGQDNEMVLETSIVVARPNRFAMRLKSGLQGVNLVSDGETLSVHVPMMNKFTRTEAPASLEETFGESSMFANMAGGLLLFELLAGDPYQAVMEGVTSTEYVGEETVDAQRRHHLKFEQEEFDWECWIAAEGEPVVCRVLMDMSKMMASQGGDMFAGAKLTSEQTYANWRFDTKPEPEAFAFTPPPGAEKVDDFFGGGGVAEPELSPLIGKPAPDIQVPLLDGGEFNLASHRDKDIVMVDFWATWCGPCVVEMPTLAEVAGEYLGKGVVFRALNQGEDAETIESFLDEQRLDITVGLDSSGSVGNAYQVEGIPTLVLIDKNGVVQSVHVGYRPDIKDVLHEELDALLEGKDLAAEALAAEVEKEANAPKPEGVKMVWSAEGSYLGLAVSRQGSAAFAMGANGTCDVFDSAGRKQGSFATPARRHLVRRARLRGEADGQLVTFRPWGSVVLAIDADGSELWKQAGGTGIDDVWPADLDGDGLDEVIVGYNGGTGLHIFDHDGKRLWEYTDIGNVWHVAAGNVVGDRNIEVITTSAAGKVHIFDASGKNLDTLDAGIYANMVRIVPATEDGKTDVILVGGTGEGEALMAMTGQGEILWSVTLPQGSAHIDSLAVAPNSSLAAVGVRGGLVVVVGLADGAFVAHAVGQGTTPQVGWLAATDSPPPVLLVTTGKALNAFELQPVERE